MHQRGRRRARRYRPVGSSALFLRCPKAVIVGVDGWRCRMVELILTTFDWVPEMPRGYVRDVRVRWALEEARLPYRVECVSFASRGAHHLAHQPFGQVPWLTDGDISIFESGAILLHLGERSEALMPRDPKGRAEVIEWIFAALNSVEMASLPWSLFKFSGQSDKLFDDFLKLRLDRLEPVVA